MILRHFRHPYEGFSRQRTRQRTNNLPGNRPQILSDPFFGKLQLAAFFLRQLHKSTFVAGDFVAGTGFPFPAPLPAVPGEHPRIGKRLPAGHSGIHNLVDVVELPPLRVVKLLVLGFPGRWIMPSYHIHLCEVRLSILTEVRNIPANNIAKSSINMAFVRV